MYSKLFLIMLNFKMGFFLQIIVFKLEVQCYFIYIVMPLSDEHSTSTFTSSLAVADEPARRAAACVTANGIILKQSLDHNHALFVGDMNCCC